MILLGQYSEPRTLQGAIDYFKSQGVVVKLTYLDSQTAQVWVSDKDEQAASKLWFEFLKDPYHSRYMTASWHTGDSQIKFKYLGKNLNLINRFVSLHWFLKLIFIVCVTIFLSFFIVNNPRSWLTQLSFNPKQPYSWLTPSIIHFSLLHLIFNLSWWLYLGAKIIKKVGFISFACLFFVSAFVSNWAQFIFVDTNFGGLSGVVYGLFGFAWVFNSKRAGQDSIIEKPVIGFMLVSMLLGFANVLFISMANWAHLFGLLSGMAIAAIQLPVVKKDQ